MCASSSAASLFNSITTTTTGFTLLTKDLQIVSEIAVIAAGVYEMLEGGAADFD